MRRTANADRWSLNGVLHETSSATQRSLYAARPEAETSFGPIYTGKAGNPSFRKALTLSTIYIDALFKFNELIRLIDTYEVRIPVTYISEDKFRIHTATLH
jgi:hypothetical protein